MKKYIVIGILLVAGVVFYALYPSEREIRNAQPLGEEIVCFGDSLTYGTGAGEGMDYPSQLSGLIGMPVVNAGVPGDTAASALARLDEDVLSGSPRMVLITLGGNDLKNRVPGEKAFSDLKRIVQAIQDKGALVVVGGLDFGPFGRGFGKEYGKLAEETGSVLVPDIFDGIWGKRSLMSDAIHPNGEGYSIMARHFRDAIKPYLQQ